MHTPTWRCLLTHCCHHPHACSTTGYGPLDQGAINQFYEAEIKGRPISKDFNAKVWSGWVGRGWVGDQGEFHLQRGLSVPPPRARGQVVVVVLVGRVCWRGGWAGGRGRANPYARHCQGE